MSEHTSHRKSLTMTHEDTVLQNAELKRELAETKILLAGKNETANVFMNQIKRLQDKEMPALKQELSETRQLLWLAVKEAGADPGRVTVRLSDLPADYEVETFNPDHSPGVVIITATHTPK